MPSLRASRASTPFPAGPSRSPGASPAYRAALALVLALCTLPLAATLFDPLSVSSDDRAWLFVRSAGRILLPGAFLFVAMSAMLALARRRDLALHLSGLPRRHDWLVPFGIASGLLLAVAAAAPLLNAFGRASSDGPPWAAFAVWAACAALGTAFLPLIVAPPAFWRAVVRREATGFLVAALASGMAVATMLLSQDAWRGMASATFALSRWFLGLWSAEVTADPDAFILGASGFKVRIAAACSGYEGLGLTLAFLSVFLFAFRRELRFPRALLLLPVGLGLVWTANALRIALLVTIGSNGAPELAVGGFHSHAGWLLFIAINLALVASAHEIGWLRRASSRADSRGARASAGPGAGAAVDAVAWRLLGPFLVLTAASLLWTALARQPLHLYGVGVAAAGALLWRARPHTPPGWRRPDAVSVGIGLLVGALWVATDPERAAQGTVGEYLGALPPLIAGLWLSLRMAGLILIVPIAEEWAFRGYLHRAASARRAEAADEARFGWLPFLITTLAFGAVHGRWLAGGLAGAAFALAMYRSGRLGGAVAAHVAANAVIAVWCLATWRFGLL